MSISRSLNLTLSLSGVNTFKRSMEQLQADAIKLRNTLNGISINTNTSNSVNRYTGSNQLNSISSNISSGISSLSNFNKLLNELIKKSIDLKIKLTGDKEVKSQLASIELEIDKLSNKLKNLTIGKVKYGNVEQTSNTLSTNLSNPTKYNMGVLGGLGNYIQNINSVKSLKQLPNVIPTLTRYNMGYLSGLSNYAQNINSLKNIKQLPNVVPTFSQFNTQIQATTQNISSLIQTGFGLHIVQIYLAPILYGLEQISAKIISTYSEFDKLFVNYKVKSEEFGEWLTKGDFYSASIGQTFGISDAAKTAERFAASGVDVAKSQQALTSVMQVATAADMDYTEAANGVIQTLAAMHMQVGQTTQVTDALINSANASTAELSDLVSWFQYSASSAYQMGVNVQDLSAYLGVLANTGTPQTGAAMRQLFLQLSKEDIQQQLKSKFSWVTDDDLTNFNTLISDMRTYVRTQNDQKAATLEITRLLGGKANAQQALQNLLMAEPDMWNNITNAVKTSGSTQDLYNKITDNASDSLKKIQINLEIIFTQLGESVGPILGIIAKVVTEFTNIFITIPGPIKTLMGLFIFFTTVLAAIAFTIIGVIGALAIMAGTTSKLVASQTLVIATTQGWSTVLRNLFKEILSIVFAGTSYGTTLSSITASTNAAASATATLTAKHSMLNSVMLGLTVGFIGYMTSSSMMQKQMYSEAYVVGTLTALWLAYNAAKMASVLGPVAAIGAGVAVGVGYEALVYDQIETMKNNAFNASMNKQLTGNTTNYRTVNNNFANVNITNDGLDLDDILDATDSDYDLDE